MIKRVSLSVVIALFFLVQGVPLAMSYVVGTPAQSQAVELKQGVQVQPGGQTPSSRNVTDASRATGIALDTVWTLVAAILVMFMQPGFAMLEAGLTRAKNAVNILMKNLMDFCFASILYWFVGFGIMFGAGNGFLGESGFFLVDAGNTFHSLSWSVVPLECKYFFQLVFCATAATIVSGAMAERTKFVAYICYSIVISAIIYPIVGHWIWGGGWLAEMGMRDFAGSTVVHSTGGWLALTGAIMLGPRIGKYASDGSPKSLPGHNIALVFLGGFILWFGWFGFNPGSTMGAVPDIAHIATTTNLSAAAAGIAAMFTAWSMFNKPDASMTINGVIAGLVAITAPCAFVSAGSAIWIGLTAGVLVVLSVLFFDRILHIDDPVGAVSAHAICGSWGTFALGLFAQDKFSPGTTGDGLFFGGGSHLLKVQSIGIISVFAWCMVTGFLLFYVIKNLFGLRVSKEEELRGLDIDEHGMEGYSGFQIFTTQ